MTKRSGVKGYVILCGKFPRICIRSLRRRLGAFSPKCRLMVGKLTPDECPVTLELLLRHPAIQKDPVRDCQGLSPRPSS